MSLLRVEAAAAGRGMTCATYQALEITKTSRVCTLWRRVGSLLLAQVRRVDWRPARTLVQVEDTEAVKVEQMSKPSTLMEEAAWSQGRGQSWRPSQEPRPRIKVFLFLLRRAPAAASKARVIESTVVISERWLPRILTSSI
jgi:hypothetical protein